MSDIPIAAHNAEKAAAFLKKARETDLSRIHEMNICYVAGRSRGGLPVVVFLPGQIPAKATADLYDELLLYIISTFEPIVDHAYAVVYIHDKRVNTSMDIGWMRKAHEIFGRKFKKNLKELYVVEPPASLRVLVWLLEHFVSKKFWNKVKYLPSLRALDEYIDVSQLHFPPNFEKCVMSSWKENPEFKLFQDSVAPLKRGCLMKQTNPKRGLKQWKSRYCVLTAESLSYYSKQGGELRGCINIAGGSIEPTPSKKAGGFCIIDAAGERYYLAAEGSTEEARNKDMKEWMDALQEAMLGEPKCFGVPLAVFVQNGHDIPPLVRAACAYLLQHGVGAEGLFRVPGSLAEMKSLKLTFDQTGEVDLTDVRDPHVVAGLLKLFFRELPEPLFTFALYPKLLSIAHHHTIDERVIPLLVPLIDEVPAINKKVFSELLTLLLAVIQNHDVNKMGVSNVATVFAPNLFRKVETDPFQDALLIVQDMPTFVKIFELILKHPAAFGYAVSHGGSGDMRATIATTTLPLPSLSLPSLSSSLSSSLSLSSLHHNVDLMDFSPPHHVLVHPTLPSPSSSSSTTTTASAFSLEDLLKVTPAAPAQTNDHHADNSSPVLIEFREYSEEQAQRQLRNSAKRGGIKALSSGIKSDNGTVSHWQVALKFQEKLPETFRKQGNVEPAFLKVLDNPCDCDAWLALGKVCADHEYNEAAREAYGQAVSLDPNDASKHFAIGKLAEKQEDWPGAQFAFEQCMALDAGNTEAATALQGILTANLLARRSRSYSRTLSQQMKSPVVDDGAASRVVESSSSSSDDDDDDEHRKQQQQQQQQQSEQVSSPLLIDFR